MVVSTVLIAGLAAGHAEARTATPTANPVLAAVVDTTNKPAPAGATATPHGAATAAPSAADAPPNAAPSAAAPSTAATPATKSGSAPAPSAPPSASATHAPPSPAQLLPNGVPTGQSYIDLSADQLSNAQAIIRATKEMGLPPRAAVIAIATSLQETKLTNYGDLGSANDHDSLGLFQQRPSSGWGTADQLTNSDYATARTTNSPSATPNGSP